MFDVKQVTSFSEVIDKETLFSLYYHSLFEYPLSRKELVKWKTVNISEGFDPKKHNLRVFKNFFILDGTEEMLYKRMMRYKISEKKLKIAINASNVLSKIPSVRMVGITGSLAMMNTKDDSDIDLMVITQKGTVWITRFFVLLSLIVFGFQIRRSEKKTQKDMICTNIFLDESDLEWKKRNHFIAHEIAQVIPLVNKDFIYEQFMEKNKWIMKYWPNAVKIKMTKHNKERKNIIKGLLFSFCRLLNPFFYFAQKLYMRKKITHEYISITRALFHPVDWSVVVNKRLKVNI